MDHLDRLTPDQRTLLDRWFPDLIVVADHSWPLQTNVVLEIESAGECFFVKASGGALMDHHLVRELRAYREFSGCVVELVPELVHADQDAKILVTRRVPGALVLGSKWERDPRVFRAAGALLRRLHAGRGPEISETYLSDLVRRGREWLDRGEGLLAPAELETVRRELDAFEPAPVALVPTHGDFGPRNWLVDAGDGTGPTVYLIDFGRAELRPWYTDLMRVHHRHFAEDPSLATAFCQGAGLSPDSPVPADDHAGWHLENLVSAVATIVWAAEIKDHEFEQEGREMLSRVLTGR